VRRLISGRHRAVRFAAALLGVAWCLSTAGPADASGPVAVYPIPGSKYNTEREQIVFRGVAPSAIGPVTVTGSVTGVHTGHIAADSDGEGGSFLPDSAFAPGETVTIATGLDLLGGSNGTFNFTIANPAGLIPYVKPYVAAAGSNGVQHFRSRPDLEPPSITVTHDTAPPSAGDIFVAPRDGPLQNGPLILDPHGKVVWFLPYPVSEKLAVTNFRVQNLSGQPVLTWWVGNTDAGYGRGEGVIYSRKYQQIATVHAANGLDQDSHEFLITPQGDAYITAAWPVHLPGLGRGTIDAVVQEIDINTGLVLFEWHSLDHIPLTASYTKVPPKGLYDPYHLNSIALDSAGNLVLSMRNTSALYDIDRQTGRVLWSLGGNSSTFKMGKGTSTWGQHDAVVEPDGSLTVFDDGAGPPKVHQHSRGIRERLDTTHDTATLIKAYDHSPRISSDFEGSMQALPGGDVFLGWGELPNFSEDTANGKQDFDAHFTAPTASYRAYRFPWTAQPPGTPSLADEPSSTGQIDLYASWNGATGVTDWRVLGGASRGTLKPLGTARSRGFETRIPVHSNEPNFEVQALGASGHVIATSAAATTRPHLTIYGSSAWVPAKGLGALAVSCATHAPCLIAATITAARTVIASTGREYVAHGAGEIYFELTTAGRSMLEHTHSRTLPVRVTLRGSSGRTAGATLGLVEFDATGAGPPRSLAQSSSLRLVGTTDFVSAGGIGSILARCASFSPCHVTTTLTLRSTVIGRTGSEFIGAGELGYLSFTLTAAGRATVAQSAAHGNQLSVHVALVDAHAKASGDIALVRVG
jgi:Arylsulfotransferase (ASST)